MKAMQISSFIAGEYVGVGGRNAFENINPADGSVISHVIEASADDVDRAVQAAKRALKGPWGRLSVPERARLLEKVAARIEERFDEFLAAEVADTGKPVTLASHLDIPRGAANFRAFASVIESAPTKGFTMRGPTGGDVINYSLRTPKGVIAVVCPWNFPLLLMTWKVAPALSCGNTVVVKPSEETPSTASLLGDVMREVGIPDGVYNVVHGFGPNSAGEYLTSHPLVDAITFTGECKTGEAIMRAAAAGTRPVSFELGGKNAGIVFADCNMEKAVDTTVRAIFMNAGQVCLHTERVYVERPFFEEFTAKVSARAKALKPGQPHDKSTTIGPLISAEHRKKVLGYYQKAAAAGARAHTGGGEFRMEGALAKGFWVEPTVWTGLDDGAAINREEIFGPCAHFSPFDSDDEVVARANDSDFGLAAMVLTENLTRAHRIAGQLEAGTCWINSWFLRDLRAPFGGAKRSGIGREGGVHSLEFYTELKNVCVPI
ncbi:MAG: 2-hydroxymuconic semialdehyde dehydrogenase [Pseudolabrys sp.]|jgi:aminomuconate-semialdehyde/2-hydroxymuconate-6-semialdehyde dehydrogenase|nr:2-hydroxymuconic semialdehyde dehydrogenase [Pseudolabrys sp.]